MGKAQIVGWAHSRFGKAEAPDTMALMAEVAQVKAMAKPHQTLLVVDAIASLAFSIVVISSTRSFPGRRCGARSRPGRGRCRAA